MNVNTENVTSKMSKIFVLFIAALLVMAGFLFFVHENKLGAIRHEVLTELGETGHGYSVFVDDESVQNQAGIVEALLSIKPHRGHHSHPEDRFVVRVEGQKNSVVLELGRDSEIKTEYWIFNPRPSVFKDSVIGCVHTDVFNDYPKTAREQIDD